MSGSFYAGDPHVLSIRDFTILRSRPQTVFAIEFYAGWCGHCQAFAPIWKSTALGACAASPSLIFGAVSCVEDFVLCREMGIAGFPTIRVFGPGDLGPKGTEPADCKNGCWSEKAMLDAILATVRASAATGHSSDPSRSQPALLSSPPVRPLTAEALLAASAAGCASATTPPPKPATAPTHFEPPVEMQQRPVPLADLASAVVYGVQRELVKADLGSDNSERRAALDAWLAALEALLPGARNRASLAQLRRAARARESLSTEEWERILLAAPPPLLPDGEPPGGIAWAACRGATDYARGYPCGLWLLFHTLLSQARTDAEATASLRAIRGYVAHFFGCTGCAQHFGQMALSPTDPLAAADTATEARLWLWRAHNAVNRRLNASSAVEVLQLGLPKVQWPTLAECADCRPRSAKLWEASAVEEYLQGSYCFPEPGVRGCLGLTLDQGAAGPGDGNGVGVYLRDEGGAGAWGGWGADAYLLMAGLGAALLVLYVGRWRARARRPWASGGAAVERGFRVNPQTSMLRCGWGEQHHSDGSTDTELTD